MNKMMFPELMASSRDDQQTPGLVSPRTAEGETEFRMEQNLKDLRDFALLNRDL